MAQAAKMDFDRGGTMTEEEVDEGGGGSKKLILIIVIVLVLLLTGAAAAYFLGFIPLGQEKADSGSVSPTEELAQEDEEDTKTGGSERATYPAYFDLNDPKKDNREYITNLMDGRRFIVVKIAAEYEMEDDEVRAFLEARRPLIDDVVLSYLSTLDSAAAQHRSARDTMKKQLKRKLNALFTAEFMEKEYKNKKGSPIKRVVIKKFLLQ